jgi:hypothetical protein
MKKLTILFASLIGILLSLAVFDAWSDARAAAKPVAALPNVYDATGAMLEAIHAEVPESQAVLVYDSTGAMLDAIQANEPAASFAPVYDATGAMLEAINP